MNPPANWIVEATSNANEEVVATQAAVASRIHHITGVMVSISAAAAGNDVAVTLKYGAVTKATWRIPAAARGLAMSLQFAASLRAGLNQAVSVTVGAAGTGAVATVQMLGYTGR